MTQESKNRIHLFGEMDLDLTDTPKNIFKEAFRIAELCGYEVVSGNGLIKLASQDYDLVKIYHKNDKVTKVEKSEDEGENWEQVDLKNESFTVTDQTLKNYNKKIKYGTERSLPMMQGGLIKSLIERYKIPAKRWGYHFNMVGIETNKQFMIWRDMGHEAHFLGLINKDGSTPTY